MGLDHGRYDPKIALDPSDPSDVLQFCISIIWCLAAILILLLRRRPAHPGTAVGSDLIRWMGFIVTGLFATSAAYSTLQFGTDGYFYDYAGSFGGYNLAPNGTW